MKTKTQTLTESQKTQARANIGALGSDYVPPTQTAEQVGADPEGTAESLISEHNIDTNAHNDIRDLTEEITTRLNALLDSDDTTLDQLSELVAYIKENRGLIEGITTDKINVADIIDNLTTAIANKPLSANQGVVLKGYVDDINTTLESKPDLTEAEIDMLSKLIQ